MIGGYSYHELVEFKNFGLNIKKKKKVSRFLTMALRECCGLAPERS